MNYNTLIFDAFDTVIHINLSKLPPCRVNGKVLHTTAPAVHKTYMKHFGEVEFDVFYNAFSQSFLKVREVRRTELREVRSQERFRELLRLLGHEMGDIDGADGADAAILDALTTAHMDQLQRTFEVRPETLEVLEWAGPRFRRAMISNFDHAPALHTALDRFGIRSAFETVVVSDEVGWRKPHPIIFQTAFEQMGITPKEALFIGDQLYVDIYGAINAGMDAAWIETEHQDYEVDISLPDPTYKVGSITGLIELLERTR